MTATKLPELLACPFCGASARRGNQAQSKPVIGERLPSPGYFVECKSCKCSTGLSYGQVGLATAIIAWNTRATAPMEVAVGKWAIEVEKRLCAMLGRQWSPGNISIESLCDELEATALAEVAGDGDARTNFTEWLAREMPPGTVIGDPRWWAPKIIRAFHDYRTVAFTTRPAPVRDGFVMLPLEPTEAMLEAARARIKEVTTIIEAGPAKGATLVREPHYNIYRAMIAAAPSPQPAEPFGADFIRSIEP